MASPQGSEHSEAQSEMARIGELERELESLRATHERSRQYWSQLEAIIDNAPLAIYLKDAAFKYLLVNREYEQLSAQPRAKILGRTDFDVLPEPVAQLFRDQDSEVVARAGPVEFRETIPLPDGVHSFITSKFPVRSEAGAILGVAGVCTEVTKLEQAQQQLAQVQAEVVKRDRLATLGELSAVIAHEVRNPLGVIFNALASLEHGASTGAQGQELLRIIHEEADRLNRMVDDLLDLASPARVKCAPTAVEALTARAIDAACALADPTAQVRLCVEGAPPSARVDEHMLRQALVNLISNAIQAPQRKSPVVVRVAMEGAGVIRFEVVDDGAGVPPALVERIFTPFFTTRARGTGLGLSVVRRVAEAHGGTVEVRATPGGGATFVLRVPLCVEPEGPLAG